MDNQRVYRRLSDGVIEEFSVDPGFGWVAHDGPKPPARSGLPLPAATVVDRDSTAHTARFEYALERIGTSFTRAGFEQQLGELIGRYSADGWRVCTSIAAGERTSHLLFERPLD